MKKFINPKINIFEFTKENIITVSTPTPEPGAGLEGGTLLSANPETAPQEVSIDTMTK